MANEPEPGSKVALVIGCSAYESVGHLTNPKHDATAMLAALQALGFTKVISAIDLDRESLLAKLDAFYAELNRAETGLLFYAGHGVQVRGRNYLLPCDAHIARASDLRTNAVPLDDVVRAMSRRAKTRLLFLDACRNDPVSGEAGGLTRGARSAPAAIGTDIAEVGQGLAKITATAGTFVAYATEPGNVAQDGAGENSPFTTALLKHIVRPGLAVDEVMMEVRVDVLDATQGQQLPWSESALTKRFQFKEGPAGPITRDFEQEYWQRVRDTDNPDFLRSFLHQFPDGRHASEARARLGGVEKRKEAADWELARTTDSIPALAHFLRRHPSSARAGAARAKLFLRQFTRGSLMFGSAVALILAIAVPVLAYLAHVVAGLLPQYLSNPTSFAEASDSDLVSTGLRLLAAMAALLIGPWFIFGTLLWVAMVRLRGRMIRRTGLAILIALVPMLLCFAYMFIDVPLQRRTTVAAELPPSAVKILQLQAQLKEQKKDAGSAPDQAKAERIRQLEQEVAAAEQHVQALSWRASIEKRHLPLLAAAVAAVTTFLTLALCAGAVSGWNQIRLWGPSMRGGALSAALGVLVWSIYTHSAWSDANLAVLFAVWLAICGFLALGVVRAAASDEALPMSEPIAGAT
jgi:hypothetical protein